MKIEEIIIEGVHFKLDQDLKQLILNKCEKLLQHDSRILGLRIEVVKDLHSSSHLKEYIAKGHIKFKGSAKTTSSDSDSMFKSIDLLIHKLDRILRRRSRIQKFKRHIPILNKYA